MIDYTSKEFYVDVKLSTASISLYLPRNSIFSSIKRALPYYSGVVLDVGCGRMPYREFILKNAPRVNRYIGLDLDNQYGKPDLVWDGRSIPLGDNQVDTIHLTEVLEHCPRPQCILNECFRVLSNGGHLIFTVPFLWPLHDVPHDEYRYTPFSLTRHFEEAGFVIKEIRALGGWDASLAQMIGLWIEGRNLAAYKKSMLMPFCKMIISFLSSHDNPPKSFVEGQMITGLTGIVKRS